MSSQQEHVINPIKVLFLVLVLATLNTAYAQFDKSRLDSTVNNLELPAYYQTSKLGEIGQVVKKGEGSIDMILIPGWGFGWEIYREFMSSNLDNYTMYAITLPGFGYTQAPPLPPKGTSYGEHIWNSGAIEGIKKLIEEKDLSKPVLVSNFLQAPQIVFWFAYKYPELISSIVIIGGMAKYVIQNWQPTLEQRISYVDKVLAP